MYIYDDNKLKDVKDTLLTRKRQFAADSDSNSLLGVLLLVCHKAK
jgi:hypothetical protein